MVRGKFTSSGDDLRHVEFLRQNGAFPEDAHDMMAIYALAIDDEENPLGMGRMYIDGDSHFRIDQMYVLPEKRRQGMGDLVIRMLLYEAQELNAPAVYLACEEGVSPFFAGYGFMPVEGKPGEMYIPAEFIKLGGCCGHE